MKYIFLDIDGVLNSDIYMASAKYLAECAALGVTPTGFEIVVKAHHLHLDPAAIKLVNDLVERSGAKVILSSTWRVRYSLFEMNAMLKMRGASFEISDKTPAKMSRTLREMDIKGYLNFLKLTEDIVPEAFVILDDIDEFPKLKDHFVQTTEKEGLTQEGIAKALKILGVEDGAK